MIPNQSRTPSAARQVTPLRSNGRMGPKALRRRKKKKKRRTRSSKPYPPSPSPPCPCRKGNRPHQRQENIHVPSASLYRHPPLSPLADTSSAAVACSHLWRPLRGELGLRGMAETHFCRDVRCVERLWRIGMGRDMVLWGCGSPLVRRCGELDSYKCAREEFFAEGLLTCVHGL